MQFTFPLVSKLTGKTSDGVVAVYKLSRAQASRIEWANQDEIDWDGYRTMLHPAVR